MVTAVGECDHADPNHQEHASVEHIHVTSRRCFIGPIPEGWLKSHRKSWYKRYLTTSNYSSRAATFSTQSNVSHQRSITGLDGPSASAALGHSFPQPDDVDQDSDDDADTSDHGGSGTASDIGNEVNDLEPQSTVAEAEGGDGIAALPDEEPPGRKPVRRATFRERLLSPSTKASRSKTGAASFVTAPMTPQKPFKSRIESAKFTKTPSSFVTAKETPAERKRDMDTEHQTPTHSPKHLQPPNVEASSPSSGTQARSSMGEPLDQATATNSATNLLPRQDTETSIRQPSKASQGNVAYEDLIGQEPQPISHGMIRFNLDETPDKVDASNAVKVGQEGRRKIWRRLRQESTHPGEIVKMEKMLVRVDSTMEILPSDYNENDSLRTSSRTVEKWREFVVVCRESTTQESDFSLQMYKTRVIPSQETTHVKNRSTHEIPLARRSTHVNLYSSLDKTLVIWVPWKMGTMMYILRTHSVASAVDWYTFIRNSLGWQRSDSLQINVPDLNVSLQLDNPFAELEASMNAAHTAKSQQLALSKTMEAERAVASTIIQRSLKMLEDNPEWADALKSWLEHERMGLAWKRYDRLEWVHGANEQRMYGTMAMQHTHDLELRPKVHYPTNCKENAQTIDEPAPIEGFLIRLTSQKGNVRRLGKMYFKRLYFTTHNQFLCYCRPAKALPPPPPRLAMGGSNHVPTASEIVEKTPMIYAVNPYPNRDGDIEWLSQGGAVTRARHDEDAYKEAERKINTMLEAEGYINLSHVVRVQNARRGNSLADANVDQGPDVDFHEEVSDTTRDDGKTNQFDDKRTFELVMKNKLVIRLQAYNEITKNEWITRLQLLVRYWKIRLTDDMAMLKKVRAMNLKALEIDEESEAYLGQFGSKWEVTRSVASPTLFNVCGIACCRAITVSTHTIHIVSLLTMPLDVRNPLPKAKTTLNVSTLRCHPCSWPSPHLPRHSPQIQRRRSPSHPARSPSKRRSQELLHLQRPAE